MTNLIRRTRRDLLDALPTLRDDLFAPLEQEFHQLFNDFFGRFFEDESGIVARIKNKADFPRLDAYVQDGQYVVEAIVAGVNPDNLEVEVIEKDGNKYLSISGKSEEMPEDTKVIRKEIRRSAFRRLMQLPPDVVDSPEVCLSEGVLTLKWELPPEEKKDGVKRTLIWGSASGQQSGCCTDSVHHELNVLAGTEDAEPTETYFQKPKKHRPAKNQEEVERRNAEKDAARKAEMSEAIQQMDACDHTQVLQSHKSRKRCDAEALPVIRHEIFDPEIPNLAEAKQLGLKFTPGRLYPIHSERSVTPIGSLYTVTDNTGSQVQVSAKYFVAPKLRSKLSYEE